MYADSRPARIGAVPGPPAAPRRRGRGRSGGSTPPPVKTPPNPYLALALRWWRPLVAGAALGTIGALGYARFGPVPYQSTVQVMVAAPTDPTADTIGSPRTVRDAASNFAAQASSMQVASLVTTALQGKMSLTTADLMNMQRDRRLDIKPVTGSSFVEITVQESDPTRATLLATTMADEFVKEVNRRAADTVATRQKQLERQIELAREQLTTAQLNQRELDLVKDLRDQRAQLLQIQTNYQQELARGAAIDQPSPADAAASPAGPSAPADRAPAQLTADAARVASQSLQVLSAQQKEQESAVATLNGQLDAVRAALRKSPTPELRQREQDLSTSLQTQRAQLLQNNQSYQQELQRLAATDQGKLTPDQERQRQDAAQASARVRSDWLKVIDDQQKDVAGNIADLERQLSDVRAAVAARGSTNDPALSAAFAQAYSQQLLALTQDYTRLQMNMQATTTPVSRYGDPSPPVPALSMKKVLPIGLGAGLALGAGAAYLLYLRERRRARADGVEESTADAADEPRPTLEPAPPLRSPPAAARVSAPASPPPLRSPATAARASAPASPARARAAARPTSPLELSRLQRLYRDSQLPERARAGESRRWPAQ